MDRYLLFLLAVLTFAIPLPAYAIDSSPQDEMTIIRGDLETIKVFGLKRVAITNPEVADATRVENNEITMVGLQEGQTTLITWDKYGKRSTLIRVYETDLDIVKKRLEGIVKEADIKGIKFDISALEGKIVLTGDLNKDKKSVLEKLIEPFGSSLVNLIKEKGEEDLIQIDAQIAEVSSNFTKKLGIDWSNASALTFSETLPAINIDKPPDVFKIGEFQRSTSIKNIVNMIITEGQGRVISRPKLVVLSGQDATIQVGGQIPIATRTIANNNIIETVIYQEYGVNMKVTPTLKEDNKIDVKMNVTISDIDSSTPVKDRVAFTNRVVQTQLYVEDRQTIILAGLIKKNLGENISRLPFLSDIPVIGALFRNRIKSPDSDLELVITLTPTILTERGVMKSSKSSEGAVKLEKNYQAKMKEGQNNQWSLPGMNTKEEAAPDGQPKIVDSWNESSSANAPRIQEIKTKKPSWIEAKNKRTAKVTPKTKSTGSKDNIESISQDSVKNEQLKNDYALATKMVPAEMAHYVRSIQEKIAGSIIYPEEAMQEGQQGTVKLALRILSDGTLASVSVRQSSGYSIFDASAIEAAKKVAPYEIFPAELNLQEMTLTIPIVYNLKNK